MSHLALPGKKALSSTYGLTDVPVCRAVEESAKFKSPFNYFRAP